MSQYLTVTHRDHTQRTMKLFVVLATVLVAATLVHSAAVPKKHSEDDAPAPAPESEDDARLLLTKLAKLAILKKKAGAASSGGYEDDKEFIVVYVKDDKRKNNNNHHHGGNKWGSNEDSWEDNHNRHPIKKVRPVRWESYEDSSSHEYVRPVKYGHGHGTKTQKVQVHTVHTSSHGDKGSSWGNWLSEKFGNKFHKDSNNWHRDDDSTEIIIKKKNNRGGHGSHGGDKWSKYD